MILAKLGSVTFIKSETDVPQGCGETICQGSQIFLALKQFINVDKEIERLQKKLNEQKGYVDNVLKKMDVPDYEKKIPEHIRLKHKEDYENYSKEYDLIKKSLDNVLRFK